MSMVEQLAEQALSLAPADRAYLANVLEQSLATGGLATAELAEAWTVAIDRRLGAYGRGETHGIDADAGLERIRQRLADHRSKGRPVKLTLLAEAELEATVVSASVNCQFAICNLHFAIPSHARMCWSK